ncbi:MAG: TIGR02221 family CRISPR-associated protein [Acidobacteria bacterium]|nr:TIGR02221 family CRISPR-associated protein [Acidobacteriota bacterium]MCW5971342.1 TIGR02221 family CRISPR-associated protein [Blastocatellales bacterium]
MLQRNKEQDTGPEAGRPLKLLTCIGTGSYKDVTYVFEQQEYRTSLFPLALAKWFAPSEILVLLTPEAKQHKNWADFQSELSDHPSVIAVDIPTGRSEDELWEIFDILTERLDEGDAVIFDITHAFRSLPILALLAASYLKVAKAVQIESLLYGAFEAKDENDRAPVFELTPFLILLDWTTATDKFLKTGDARELAMLLKSANSKLWRSHDQKNRGELPQHLNQLSGILDNLSSALSLTRPADVRKHAEALSTTIDKAAAETTRWAKPFTLLLQRTEAEYTPFSTDTLIAQRELIRWYIRHQHYVQAITLAREWLISLACQQLKQDLLQMRREVEDTINSAARRARRESYSETPLLTQLSALPSTSLLIDAWNQTVDLRNDVAHCGMRLQPRDVRGIIRAAVRIVESLDKFELDVE